MKIKTDKGKDHYNLWFILEGRCECKGGRDGGCKHIAAAMYSPEDLLNTRGKESVTSGPCTWVKRQRASTVACQLKNLLIQIVVCAPKDTNPPDEENLRNFTQKMCQLPTSGPVILPLIKKLYCPTEADTDHVGETIKSNEDKLGSGVIKLKLEEL